MRSSISKLMLPLLVLTLLALRLSGVLDTGSAVIIFFVTEGIILAVAAWNAREARKRYRHSRSSGADSWTALEEGASAFLPGPLGRLLVHEVKIFWCIWERLVRRYRPGQAEFSYDRGSILGMILVVVALTAPVEILVVHLLVPWEWLRWGLVVVSIYGFLWLVGVWSSLRVLPHRLETNGIRLRYGTLAEAFVPYSSIVDIAAKRAPTPNGKEGLVVSSDGTTAYLSVGSRTDVEIHLEPARTIQGLVKETEPVGTMRVAVDEPERFVADVRGKRCPVSATAGTN